MVLLKAVTVIAAGVLSMLALRQILHSLEAQKVRVKASQQPPRPMTRLRQDPRTGVYYPEN
jgi:pseudouridine-5'-phosphate glycosidase